MEQIQQLRAVAPYRYNQFGELVCQRGLHLPSRFAAAYEIVLLLGLRKGEILGLRWCDVDLDKLTISINQQVRDARGRVQIVPPKSPEAVRTLPITLAIADLLRAQRAMLDSERAKAGDRWRDFDLVFPAENGVPKEPAIFYATLRAC